MSSFRLFFPAFLHCQIIELISSLLYLLPSSPILYSPRDVCFLSVWCSSVWFPESLLCHINLIPWHQEPFPVPYWHYHCVPVSVVHLQYNRFPAGPRLHVFCVACLLVNSWLYSVRSHTCCPRANCGLRYRLWCESLSGWHTVCSI